MFLRTRPARRAVRAVAGVVASLLFSGNVLAAAGLCVLKPPPTVPAASEATCAQHLVDDSAPSAAQHCPTDSPSAQARTADLPTAQLLAAAAVTPFGSFAAPTPALPELRADAGSPQRPLYARLQRLHL
jgi:hypothetical protein